MRKTWLLFLLGVLSVEVIRAAIPLLVTLNAFENIFCKKSIEEHIVSMGKWEAKPSICMFIFMMQYK